MKRNRSYFGLVLVVLLQAACSKSNAPDPAPPPSTGGGGGTTSTPIVVKTMGVNTAQVLMDSLKHIYLLNLTNGFGNTIKFVPGNTLQLELVNAVADPRTVIGSDFSVAYYSNVKKGDVGVSLNVTAADSASNVFFRVKGFDYSKVNFQQLNVILCEDGVNNPATISLGYSYSAAAPGAALLTSQALRNIFNTKLDRIQLVIGGAPYY